MASQANRGVPLSTLSPKFLHTNSTSHTWPFGAIAELIDNAYDPDVKARHFWIDKTVVHGKECLTFMDDGNGLTNKLMHKMLSFGYSDKTAVNGLEPIGIYGNGFKSGSMRLGRDAVVFSRSKNARCVGMLSQTYLEEIKAQQICVPIVCFEGGEGELRVRAGDEASLLDILKYSPFKTLGELHLEVDAITSSPLAKTGTRIIIWNLRRTSTDTTEFDFEKDRYDIRIPSDVCDTLKESGAASYIPESFHSLRAYCSILYLKPQMQIVIRGQKVKSQLISKSLAFIRKDHYKPNFVEKQIPITFGYNTKSKDQYGVMMYHKNRLIKPYYRVGCQRKANYKGVGVIAIIECNFLDPTHNKQSFNESDKYNKTIYNLGLKLEEYWNEIQHERRKADPDCMPVEDVEKRPDQNWAQCDNCSKWRKLPDGINISKLPDQWFCHMNPDPQFRSCSVDQEPVDSDEEQPTYRKTYKQQERKEKRNKEMKRQMEELQRKCQEEKRLAELTKQNKALKRKLRKKSASPRSASVASLLPGFQQSASPRSSSVASLLPGFQQSARPPAFVMPMQEDAVRSPHSASNNDGLLVITNVCSLSPGLLSGKRPQPPSPETTPKRQKHWTKTLDISELATVPYTSPPSSPSLLEDYNPDTGGDLNTQENIITPQPEQPGSVSFNVKAGPETGSVNVKMESESGSVNVKMESESDSVNVEMESETGSVDVKMESEKSNTATLPEVRNRASHPAATVKPVSGAVSVGLVSSPTTGRALMCNSAQTTVFTFKNEEPESQNEGETSFKQVDHLGKSFCVTQQPTEQEIHKSFQGERPETQRFQTRVTYSLEGVNDASGSTRRSAPQYYLNTTEELEKSEQVQSLKEQVQTLTVQLQEREDRLKELRQSTAKKACSHQCSQTEDGGNYKPVLRKVKQKIDELIQKSTFSLTAAHTETRDVQGEEKELDDIVHPVKFLIQELEQRNRERDELFSQLDIVENEKTKLEKECEQKNFALQQAENPLSLFQRTTGPKQYDSGNTAETAYRSTLISLRHNVGRFLVRVMPVLELDQVNFECDVIDEMLEQFLIEMDCGRRNLNVDNIF